MQLSRYVRVVRGMAGLGMGQDDDGFGDEPIVLGESASPVEILQPSGPTTYTVPFSSSDITNLQDQAAAESAGIGGTLQAAYAAATSPSAGGGFNLSTFLSSLTGSAASAAKLYQTLQGPSLIPGTNAIYNPATGQYYNPTTGQVVNPSGVSTLGLPSIDPNSLLLYGGLTVGAIFLLSMLGKR